MRVVIVEDEEAASRRLISQIKSVRENYQIEAVLQSVEEAVRWFEEKPSTDLVMMDIQLADGLSFSIFSQTKISSPIIFTTAFDQYALKAFKVNSVDYLLKPIDTTELKQAFIKLESRQSNNHLLSPDIAAALMQSLSLHNFKSRFLVKAGNNLQYLNAEDIALFYSEDGLSFVRDLSGQRFLVDATLDHLETSVHPERFFRINRKAILHIQSIENFQPYHNGRLQLNCNPAPPFELIVARERAVSFKKWVDGE